MGLMQKIASLFRRKQSGTEKDSQEGEIPFLRAGLREKARRVREIMRKNREQLVKGDKTAWYHFWMGTLLFFTGLALCMTVIIDFFMELQAYRAWHSSSVVSGLANQRLPAGEYSILQLYVSTTLGPDDEPAQALQVCRRMGGAPVVVILPDGIDFPESFYTQDSYVLKVDDEGRWIFLKTEKMKRIEEEMKKAKETPETAGDGHQAERKPKTVKEIPENK